MDADAGDVRPVSGRVSPASSDQRPTRRGRQARGPSTQTARVEAFLRQMANTGITFSLRDLCFAIGEYNLACIPSISAKLRTSRSHGFTIWTDRSANVYRVLSAPPEGGA